jgi:hypothetical protein
MAWGDEYYSPDGPRRVLRHVSDDGLLDESARCQTCGEQVGVADTLIVPGPGYEANPGAGDGVVAGAFTQPRRMLEPIRG